MDSKESLEAIVKFHFHKVPNWTVVQSHKDGQLIITGSLYKADRESRVVLFTYRIEDSKKSGCKIWCNIRADASTVSPVASRRKEINDLLVFTGDLAKERLDKIEGELYDEVFKQLSDNMNKLGGF